MSNKIDDIALNHGQYVMDIIEEDGHIYLIYGDDRKYVCKSEHWEIFKPGLNGFMSYAFGFGGL